MALSATIFKVTLQITDLDRNYYQAHELVIARHPSETDQRMMLRLLAFARHADERLQFTKGLSSEDEPDLWQKSLSGEIELWVDLGQPDEKRIRKACGRARRVVIYPYSGHGAQLWWEQNKAKLARFDNLQVVNIPAEQAAALAQLVQRQMHLQCTIQDGELWLSNDQISLEVTPEDWSAAPS